MIQLFHVSLTYPGAREPALRDITLEVAKGAFAFLAGPSGAGKSSLLRLLFAAEQPSEGQILIAGRNITRLSRASVPYLRRNIGVVFQDYKLLPRRTVYDNVAVVLEVLGQPARQVRERVYAMLKHVGLAHKLNELPPRLSGGEQQRVAIARALINDPQLLLADEPTGNLDRDLTAEIIELLKDVNARGTTMLIATHDRGLIERHGDRVLTIERGRLRGE